MIRLQTLQFKTRPSGIETLREAVQTNQLLEINEVAVAPVPALSGRGVALLALALLASVSALKSRGA